MSGAAFRLQPRGVGHWGPPVTEEPDEEEPMSLAMQHASSPEFWVGALGMVLGEHARGRTNDRDVQREYREFWESPLVQDDTELRALLPAPTPRKDGK